MSGNQDNGSFSVEKAFRTYNILTLLMIALVAGAGGLHYVLAVQQKSFVATAAAARDLFAQAQRIEAAVSQHQATHDPQYLQIMKEAAAAALADHDALAPAVRESARAANGGIPVDPPGLKAVHTLIDESFGYASTPSDADAAAMAGRALWDIPRVWGPEAEALLADRQERADELVALALIDCAALLGLLLYGALGVVRPAMAQVARQREYLERMAATDPLTATYNRAMLFKVTAGLISSAKRYKHDMAALAVDIDGLQKINDADGRAAGDGAIRAVAKAMAGHLRTSDVMGRTGGGEFGIFLPSTDEYRASHVAEKLRAAVEELPYAVKDKVILLRVSIGIAEMKDNHRTPDDILRAAENALRHAKDAGRNRVVTAGALQKADGAAQPAAAPG